MNRIVWWLAAVVLLVAGCGRSSPARPSLPPGQFSIVTYNINAGMPGNAATLEAIGRSGADVICLQEVCEEWRPSLRERFGREYPHVLFDGQGFGGLAVLSKYPVKEVGLLWPGVDGGWFSQLLLEADTPAGKVQILDVHLRPNWWKIPRLGLVPGDTGDIRRNEVAALSPHLKAGVATVILGDFNEGDGGAATTWLREKGLVDALPQFDARSPTWHDRKWRVTLEARADRIMYSRGLRCLSAAVSQTGESDHFPVKAVFSK